MVAAWPFKTGVFCQMILLYPQTAIKANSVSLPKPKQNGVLLAIYALL